MQCGPILRAQGLEQLVLDKAEARARAGQLIRACCGKLDDMPAPVRRVPPAGNKPAFLELVEQADDIAWVQPQRFSQRLLADRPVPVKQRERDKLPGAKAVRD